MIAITSQDVEDFTCGGCSLLAEAIHDAVPEYELACFIAGGHPCGHAFVKLPDGRYLDITGVHTHREMLDSHWGRPGKRHGRRGITTAHYAGPLVLSDRRAELEFRARLLVPAVLALTSGTDRRPEPDPNASATERTPPC